MKIKTAFLITLILFSLSFTFAAEISEPSYCCERTLLGASCINTLQDECNPKFKSSPTSCETTSYCKLGTCYDSEEGLCMENVPQQICSDSGGTWDEREADEVPQCQLGCCIIADQAAFVPLVRCKHLSTLFGVETNYDTSINSELECIATAQSQDMGACVFEEDFQRVCKFTTRADCGADVTVEDLEELNSTEITNTQNRRFYKDFLCSAEELNTQNAKQVTTGCYQGDVYWFDSESQRENIYSSDSDASYNNGRVADPDEICDPNGDGNNNCGNCEYLLGTRCSPEDNILTGVAHSCKKIECTDREGNKRLNGESWCVNDGIIGNGTDRVGSRYYREICIDGKVRVEPCSDFRNEICIEGSIDIDKGSYSTSACRANRWQDCTLQTEEEACLNTDRRDCTWFGNVKGMLLGSGSTSLISSSAFTNPTAGNSFNNPTANPKNTITSSDDEEDIKRQKGVCVPFFPPGLKFWEEGSAQTICNQASVKCEVIYEKGLLDGGWKVQKNGECLEDEWGLKANRVCSALGDCGGYVNYQGVYTDDGYEWEVDNEDKKFSPNTVNKIKGGFTGLLIDKITQ